MYAVKPETSESLYLNAIGADGESFAPAHYVRICASLLQVVLCGGDDQPLRDLITIAEAQRADVHNIFSAAQHLVVEQMSSPNGAVTLTVWRRLTHIVRRLLPQPPIAPAPLFPRLNKIVRSA